MTSDVIAEDRIFTALAVAEDAAREAGIFLQRKRGTAQVLHKKARRDGLLDADLEAEKIIIHRLRESFPDDDILSEETKLESKGSAYQWVIDPLDGSFNFQHGNPTFGVSISLRVNDITRAGVTYLPLQQEMFTAILGHGAYLNGGPIYTSNIADLDDAVVHVGDFAKDGSVWKNEERLQDIIRLANEVGRVRMIGTAATDLAYVACGRAEALVVHNAKLWDIEVGRLLIKEAGGEATYQEHENGSSLIVCSNKNIHKKLLDILLRKTEGIASIYKKDPEYGSIYAF